MGRIFLLADHAALVDTISMVLTRLSHGTMAVVGSGAVTLAGIGDLVEHAPDAVLLTVGVDALRELHVAAMVRALAPQTQILVIDTMGEGARAVAAYPQPIDALLSVEELPGLLVPTLRRLLARPEKG